jgi:tetratricopeptide (TPR) repeat protein
MPTAARAETDAMRGRALSALGRFEQALEHLPRTDFASMCQRIDALEALGRIDEADGEIDQALALAAPNDARADELIGRRAARRGRFDEAVAAFRNALAKEPLDRAALFGLGQALVKSGKRDEGTRVLAEHRRLLPLLDQLDFAEQSLDLDPRNGPNYAALGDAERALGRIERAEAAYVRAEELAEPDQLVPIVLRHARLLAEDRRDIDGAVRVLEAAAQRTPDPRLLVRAGDLLAEAGRAREAVERLERALALRPQDAQIQRRLEAARAALSK